MPRCWTQRSGPSCADVAWAAPSRCACTHCRRRPQPPTTAGGNQSRLSARPPAHPPARPLPRPSLPSPTPAPSRTWPSGASFRAPLVVHWPGQVGNVRRVGARRCWSLASTARGRRQTHNAISTGGGPGSGDGSSANFGVSVSLAYAGCHEPPSPANGPRLLWVVRRRRGRPRRARNDDCAGWQRQRQGGCRLWRLAAAGRLPAAAAAVAEADGGWRRGRTLPAAAPATTGGGCWRRRRPRPPRRGISCSAPYPSNSPRGGVVSRTEAASIGRGVAGGSPLRPPLLVEHFRARPPM